jgi:16S rRNA processing protein RimM
VLHFTGLDDRNQVEPLVGSLLYAHSESLPQPEEDEYWVDDLIALDVVDLQTNRKRGTVKDLLSSGGQDFLEIQLEDSSHTVVIPFISKFFPTVDVANKTISVDLLSDFLSMANEPVTVERLEQ